MDITRIILHDFLIMFAMVNALGNLPVFADLTGHLNQSERHHTFVSAVAVGCGIVLIFALFGDVMLRHIFEISTSAFKIAGGILVFIVAIQGVLTGSNRKKTSNTGSDNLAVFPLGFPYLAGPGTILTTILLIQSSGRLVTVVTVLLVYITVLPLLFLAPLVEKAISKVGVMVVARILYIFICAKGISFILSGMHINI